MGSAGNLETWLPDSDGMAVIRAGFEEFNAGRPAQIDATMRRIWLVAIGVATVALAAAVWSQTSGNGYPTYLIFLFVLFLGALAWKWVFEPSELFELQLRKRLFPVIFGFISNFRHENGTEPQFLERFRKTGLLDWSKFEAGDCMTGRPQRPALRTL